VTADLSTTALTTTPAAAGSGDLAMAALGDGTRRAIVELLAERPRAVGELAERLPVTRPAVSLHLKVLKDAHLVRDTPVGTRRVYRLDAEGLTLLRTYLDRLWAGALDAFATAAEAAAGTTTHDATTPRSPRT
jgi:DNA-binding transcriptional ArsR family regulator